MNAEVVMDSVNAPNFDKWQTNAFGAGKDVSFKHVFLWLSSSDFFYFGFHTVL
jgi:hypothetical protein